MKTSEESRDRFYKEVGIHLAREGFSVLEQRDGLLPLEWCGAPLCRITAGGGAQFRRDELEPEGAGDAFQLATEIAHTTAEYMRLMETAPHLQAKGLDGDYRLLADFNDTVLAGHLTSRGAEFVTWERLLSLSLALILCLMLLPGAALAEGSGFELTSAPIIKNVLVCQDGSDRWLEVSITTPGDISDVIQMLSLFNLDGLIDHIQMNLSVDGGSWQMLDLTFNGEGDQWYGTWRTGYLSSLQEGSTAKVQIRYFGQDDKGTSVVSPWSESVSVTVTAEPPFEFNAHDWAKPELTEADGLGLIPADLRTADLTQPITRAEFAAVSVKVYEALSGLTAETAAENPFTDTSDPEVLKALNVGITNGLSETEFAPDKLLNREQAATMLSRVYKKVAFDGWTLGTDGDFAEAFRALFTMPEAFTDDADISSWARDSVYFMAANGILKGMEGGTFQPRAVTEEQQAAGYAQATREQAILIAVRLVKNLGT